MTVKVFSIFAIVSLAACNAETGQNNPATTSPPMQTASAPATQMALADGTWTGVFDRFAGTATLEVRNGQPVSYSTNSGYRAQQVSLRGGVIRVDQARLTIDSVSENRFSGRWVLGEGRSNVVFTK